jgi:hypothetical protein
MATELGCCRVFAGERVWARKRKEIERASSWHSWAAPGGRLDGLAANRRWPRRSPRSLRAGACLLEEEDKGDFAHSPLGFGVLLGILQTALVFAK